MIPSATDNFCYYLLVLPDEDSVGITELEDFFDLDRSMVERLIGARYREMSEGGEMRLVARRHNPRSRDLRAARSKGL